MKKLCLYLLVLLLTFLPACAAQPEPEPTPEPPPALTLVEGQNAPRLVLRDTVAAEYTEEITDLASLEAFLTWAKEKYPDKTPLMVPFNYNPQKGYPHEIISLLCAAYGYAHTDALTGIQLGFVENGGAPVPAEQTEVLTKGLEKLLAWQEKGYVKLVNWEVIEQNLFALPEEIGRAAWENSCAVWWGAPYWEIDTNAGWSLTQIADFLPEDAASGKAFIWLTAKDAPGWTDEDRAAYAAKLNDPNEVAVSSRKNELRIFFGKAAELTAAEAAQAVEAFAAAQPDNCQIDLLTAAFTAE